MRHSIQPNRQHCWHTGLASDGHQCFFGLDADAAVCLRFDPDGSFLGAEARPLAEAGIANVDLEALGTVGTHAIPPTIASLNPAGCRNVAVWAGEVLVKESAVRVLEFEYPERRIAVRPMPALYAEFLESPWAYDEEERFGLAVKIRRWSDLERFVVLWHGEHWCARDGLIHS